MINYIDLLKVRNGLYEWGLKEHDFDVLQKKFNEYCEKFEEIKADIDIPIKEFRENLKFIFSKSKYSEPKLIVEETKLKLGQMTLNGNIIGFDLPKDSYKHLNELFDLISCKDSKFTSLERIKQRFLFDLKSKINGGYSRKMDITFDQLESIKFILNLDLLPDSEITDIQKVLDVIEEKNERIAIVSERSYRGVTYEIRAYNTNNPQYNYIDRGRLMYENNLFLWELKEADVHIDVLSKIKSSSSHEFMLVDKRVYNDFKSKFSMKLMKEKEEEELEDIEDKQISILINSLDTKPFTYRNITFSKRYVEYSGLKVGGPKCNLAGFLKQKLTFDDTINFNQVVSRFIGCINEEEFKEGRKNQFVVGNVVVKPSIVKKENSVGYSNYYYINGVRVNKDETLECLNRAVCYQTQEDYDGFLNIVSKCSLKIHKALGEGLVYTFSDRGYGDDTQRYIRLKLIRRDNHNFIKTEKREIKVSNTNKLIDKSKSERAKFSLEELIDFLKEELSLGNDEVLSLIKEGLQEHLTAIRKSEQLLAQTIKQIKAKEATATADGIDMDGYLVIGVSGKQYFVHAKDDHTIKVYTYPGMNYICIVSQQLVDVVGKDKLVSYLLALYNDSYVAKDIPTLGMPQNLMHQL